MRIRRLRAPTRIPLVLGLTLLLAACKEAPPRVVTPSATGQAATKNEAPSARLKTVDEFYSINVATRREHLNSAWKCTKDRIALASEPVGAIKCRSDNDSKKQFKEVYFIRDDAFPDLEGRLHSIIVHLGSLTGASEHQATGFLEGFVERYGAPSVKEGGSVVTDVRFCRSESDCSENGFVMFNGAGLIPFISFIDGDVMISIIEKAKEKGKRAVE